MARRIAAACLCDTHQEAWLARSHGALLKTQEESLEKVSPKAMMFRLKGSQAVFANTVRSNAQSLGHKRDR